ncbi:hypothetical protein CsSME_00003776 [Camellia sinensis var. sinensis]
MSMSMSSTNASMGSIREVRFDNRNCRCGSEAMVKISQSTDNPNCLYFVCPNSPNGCKFFEWWIPPHMQHNLKVVENDILEERMDVLSTLREIIILKRELKDIIVKSRKQYRDLAMVIERVGDKLNYAFAFIVLLLVVVVILVYLK